MTIFYCLTFKAPQPGGPGPCIYIPQEQGGPVIPPGTGLTRTFITLPLNWIVPVDLFITLRRGPHRKRCRSPVVACVFVSAATCLHSRCSETAVFYSRYCIATPVLVVCFEVFA
jgi:hypothetical protein